MAEEFSQTLTSPPDRSTSVATGAWQSSSRSAPTRLKSARRNLYEGVEFAPDGAQPGNFNTWTGFSVEPAEDAWSMHRELIVPGARHSAAPAGPTRKRPALDTCVVRDARTAPVVTGADSTWAAKAASPGWQA